MPRRRTSPMSIHGDGFGVEFGPAHIGERSPKPVVPHIRDGGRDGGTGKLRRFGTIMYERLENLDPRISEWKRDEDREEALGKPLQPARLGDRAKPHQLGK